MARNFESQGGDIASRFLGGTTDVSLHSGILEQPEGEENAKG